MGMERPIQNQERALSDLLVMAFSNPQVFQNGLLTFSFDEPLHRPFPFDGNLRLLLLEDW
jgi:hypothetical protein